MNKDLENYFHTSKVISVSEAAAIGISRAMLSYFSVKGDIQRIAQGLYAPASEIPDELLVFSKRSANVIFSHETALALHKLHNRIPAMPSFTIPTGSRSPRSLDNAAVVYHVKKELHGLGRCTAVSFLGNEVPCYDAERTICDVVRSRSRLDVETYANALRNYAASKEKNLPLLFRYAKAMGVESKVHDVLRVLV